MGTKHLRYTIEVDGCARKILSVSLRKTGLIFDLKPALFHRPADGKSAVDGRIEYSKATFHHSLESPTGNLITKTTVGSSGNNRQTQFTRALKSTNNFAEIFGRRLPDLSKGWPVSNGERSDVSLGKLDPVFFNLVICVFVGNADRKFSLHNDPVLEYGINVNEQTIGNYKIIILYSFYEQPSIDHGTSTFLWTTKPENLQDISIRENNCIMNGFNDYEVRERFFSLEHKFKRNYLELTDRWMGDRKSNGTLRHEDG